jgi:hypothetical protein
MRDWLLLVGAGFSLLGCESDCEQVCEAAYECNIFVEFLRYDCDDACDLEADWADANGCYDYYANYYDCLADGQRDECLFVDPCNGERAAYNACLGR